MDNKLSELSKPMRIHRDWNSASMCHCGKCDRWEMTIADADGVQTCASCYEAEWLSEWQNYAEAAEKRIAELEAKLYDSRGTTLLVRDAWQEDKARADAAEKRLATPVRLPDIEFVKISGIDFPVMRADIVKKEIRRAGFTVEGDDA